MMAEGILFLYGLVYIVCARWVYNKIWRGVLIDDPAAGLTFSVSMAISPILVIYYKFGELLKWCRELIKESSSMRQYAKAASILTSAAAALVVFLIIGLTSAQVVIAKSAMKNELREKAEVAWRLANMHELGLIGPRQLRSHPIVGMNGQIHGSVFLFSGSIKGNIQTEPLLVVSWKNEKGVEYNATIPYRMFRMETDESLTVPTVEFLFNTNDMQSYREPNHPLPTEYINKYLRLAKVKMSSATKEKEIYLPH